MVRIGVGKSSSDSTSKDGETSIVKIDSHSHIYPDFYKEVVIAAGWNSGPDGMLYHPVNPHDLTLSNTDNA
jgi:hypothetical protein